MIIPTAPVSQCFNQRNFLSTALRWKRWPVSLWKSAHPVSFFLFSICQHHTKLLPAPCGASLPYSNSPAFFRVLEPGDLRHDKIFCWIRRDNSPMHRSWCHLHHRSLHLFNSGSVKCIVPGYHPDNSVSESARRSLLNWPPPAAGPYDHGQQPSSLKSLRPWVRYIFVWLVIDWDLSWSVFHVPSFSVTSIRRTPDRFILTCPPFLRLPVS